MSGTDAPVWTHERPWRNNNPGDLRPLPRGETWNGQVGVDTQPNGAGYVRFANRTMGWRALAMCLLAYQDRHGIRTINGIAERWAPGDDGNNTRGYAKILCYYAGVSADATIDVHCFATMLALAHGVAIAEGSARIIWPEDEKIAGVQMALEIWHGGAA